MRGPIKQTKNNQVRKVHSNKKSYTKTTYTCRQKYSQTHQLHDYKYKAISLAPIVYKFETRKLPTIGHTNANVSPS